MLALAARCDQRVCCGAGQGEDGGAEGAADIGSDGGFAVSATGFGLGFGLAVGFAVGGGAVLRAGGAGTRSTYTGFGVMRGGALAPVAGSMPSPPADMRTGTVCG